MAENKSSISSAGSYRETGEFWDTHDLADFENETKSVDFEVQLQSSRVYIPLEKDVAQKLRSAAESHGVSAEQLLNLWLQEKIAEESQQK